MRGGISDWTEILPPIVPPARSRLDDIRLEARTELQRAIGYGREVLRAAGMANFVEIS